MMVGRDAHRSGHADRAGKQTFTANNRVWPIAYFTLTQPLIIFGRPVTICGDNVIRTSNSISKRK